MELETVLHRLRSMRTRKGFTQEDIAKVIGCSSEDYSKKERGLSAFTTEEWLKIADALKMHMALFFLMVPLEVLKESHMLLYGYNLLPAQGRETIKELLNSFLIAHYKNRQKKLRKEDRSLDAKEVRNH